MKHIAKNGEDAVAIKDMLSVLSSSHHPNMDEIAVTFAEKNPKSLSNTRDVTMEFLVDSKLHGPDLLSCPYAMYRGLTQALLASKDKYVRKQQIGILGGNNDLVLDVILGTDVTTTLDTPELNSRWDSLEYQPMGLVLFADGDDNSPLQHVATVREVFARVQKPVLLIVFGKSIEPMTWMFNDHDESEKFIRVEIDSKGKKRRKNADYRVIPVDQLGVTFDDEAAFLVSQAICNQLGKVVSSEQGMEKQCFEKKAVPPDGYCFWHSVLAGLQPERFCRIERSENGWAINKRQEKLEETAAKHLLQLAVDAGLDPNLFKHGYVDVAHIASVAKKLNLAVRCTMSNEALCFVYLVDFRSTNIF